VDAHDGKISVYSEGQGHGCVFTIDIPVIIDEVSIASSIKQPGSPYLITKLSDVGKKSTEMELPVLPTTLELKPLLPTFCFLVVDDSSVSRKMIIKYIRSLGYICDIDEAENGIEAVENIEKSLQIHSLEYQKKYDAIFMDNVMPKMDGPRPRLSRKYVNGFIQPIYGVTGNVVESDIKDFMLCGVNEVFKKPIDAKGLSRAISALSSPLLKPV
jgi:CheY-like chemotaxis protein